MRRDGLEEDRTGLASPSRRTLLAGLGALAAPIIGPTPLRASTGDPPASRFVRRVVKTPANTYSTYPHANGFLPDGRCIIAAPTNGPRSDDLDYIVFDPERGTSSLVAHSTDARMYWSVAGNGVMAFATRSGVSICDLTERRPAIRHIVDDAGWTVSADSDIAVDGTRALVTRSHHLTPQAYQTDLVDIRSSQLSPILKPGWPMDHAHFSPYDQGWVCYCDNRPKLPDRLWVWNAKAAPEGAHLFNQVRPDGTSYDIGHERAMFNKPALLVVAYGGHSTARPLGLFEVSFDGRVRLVSPSNQDFHCNVSRDGRWAVVSLQGAYDPDLARPSSGWLKTGPGYGVSDVMLVALRTGRRAFLYRATNSAGGQPYEAQPSISPDGRYVLCKDAREMNVHALEMDQRALGEFLAG